MEINKCVSESKIVSSEINETLEEVDFCALTMFSKVRKCYSLTAISIRIANNSHQIKQNIVSVHE